MNELTLDMFAKCGYNFSDSRQFMLPDKEVIILKYTTTTIGMYGTYEILLFNF